MAHNISLQSLLVVKMKKNTIKKLISQLEANGYKVATKILKSSEFYKADEGHQNYYKKKGSLPYCHSYKKRF